MKKVCLYDLFWYLWKIKLEEYNSSMLLLQKLKKLIYHSDMFCSSEMLRYDSESQYKTLTGGLFSISIIAFIVVVFASMISDTFNKTTIAASLQTIKRGDPPLFILKTSKEGMFMFGLAIQSYDTTYNADLGTGPRYFDFFFAIDQTQSGQSTNLTQIQLEQCTPSHWQMLPDIKERFDALGASKWLCPPKDMELHLRGIYNSAINSQILIAVSPCVNGSNNSRDCAPQEQIDALMQTYQNFYLTINYINPVISPTQPEHISYYSEVNDYIIFSKTMGSQVWIFFSDYTINTDDSIWPLQNNIVETGSIVEQRAVNHAYRVTSNTPYAIMYLAKSSSSLIYTRTVQKISAILSYIGGLVGAMTALLFLIKTYTDCSLEMSIGINLFNDYQNEETKEQQPDKPSFNFFKFIGLYIYQLIPYFKINKKWQNMRKLSNFQRQIVKQLDIRILLKRIISLQQSMTYLLDDIQLEGMKYQKSISCERVRRNREILLQEFEKEEDQTQRELQNICSASNDSSGKVKNELTENNLNIHQLIQKEIHPSIFKNKMMANHLKKDNLRILSLNAHDNIEESNPSENIPVEFLQKNQKNTYQRQSCAKMISIDLIDRKSIQNLKILHKKSKLDTRSSRIWMNLRNQVQQIIKNQIQDNNQRQIYS